MIGLKFRVWNGKEMTYIVNGGEYQLTFGMDCNWSLWNEHEEVCNSDNRDCALMMFTGLQDKNNKDIYEGDIVTGERESHWHGGYDKVKAKVYFSDFNLSFSVDGIGGGSLYNIEEIEVIGNIYENPELLEEM